MEKSNIADEQVNADETLKRQMEEAVPSYDAYGDGHVFNVINDAGTLLIVDSQMKHSIPYCGDIPRPLRY